MKKLFLFIGLFCSFFIQAQEVMKESVSQKKVAVQSLNQVFSTKVLNAYQENSISKIDDLFSYFQLLTDANLTNDLKKEVVKNINQLFNNQNPLVLDVTSQSLNRIPLQALLQKLLISEPILFKILDETTFNAVDYKSWKTNYSITRTKSGSITKIKIIQTVYFFEVSKQFGENSKEVWSTYLDEMN